MSPLPTTTIEIDIEVHRAIEARRTSFDQSANDILRKTFKFSQLDNAPRGNATSELAYGRASSTRRIVRTRRTGAYGFTLQGEHFEEASLREAYKRILLELAKRDSQFLERLAERRTRSRRLVARDPRNLFLKTPELAEKFADRLTGPWWFDVNLSQQQVDRRVKIACEVAGLRFGVDVRLEFPD